MLKVYITFVKHKGISIYVPGRVITDTGWGQTQQVVRAKLYLHECINPCTDDAYIISPRHCMGHNLGSFKHFPFKYLTMLCWVPVCKLLNDILFHIRRQQLISSLICRLR